MKIITITIIISSLLFISCSKVNNPVSTEEKIGSVTHCRINGLDINFIDTCSYNFVVQFLSTFDSVTIIETHLGSDFYIYTDSGDFNYWVEYFKNDSTIQYLFNVSTTSDSLIMEFVLSGQKSVEEERRRFNEIDHLEIINIVEHTKSAYVVVPEDSEFRWVEKFKDYYFITYVNIIGVCTDS